MNQVLTFTFSILLVLVFFIENEVIANTEDYDENNENLYTTPHMEYGTFNEDENEKNTTLFFQYGRFFGISGGLGVNNALGNRGKLYDVGLPLMEIKFHYWFNFNLAIQMVMSFATHEYGSTDLNNLTEVNLRCLGADIKYYFDTRNLSAPIDYVNPYVFLGLSQLKKTEFSSTQDDEPSEDDSFSYSLGGGIEFPISEKKVYFVLEGRYSIVRFDNDNDTSEFERFEIKDLSGNFASFIGQFLFTW